MRIAALIAAVFCISLAGCSSSGINSHPLPAAPAASPAANSISINLQGTVSTTTPGAYPLSISVTSGGQVLPNGTALASPVTLSSNDTANVGFASSVSGSAQPTMTVNTVGTPIFLVYTPCAQAPCGAPPATITITAAASGITGGNIGTLVINGPQSGNAVTALSVALFSGPPNLSTAGIYPLSIGAFNNGVLLPPTTSYQYPISITSNDSSYLSFSINSNGSQASPSVTVPNGSTPVYLIVTPCSTSGSCPANPQTITITASAPGIVPSNFGTTSFPPMLSNNALPVTNMTLTLPSGAPNVTASGIYPITINATDAGVTIPLANPFQYPISLSSNDSSYIGFTSNSNGTQPTPTITVPNSGSNVYMVYTACTGSNCPQQPAQITITASTPTAPNAQIAFAAPNAPVSGNPSIDKLTLALQGPPPSHAQSGSYPLVVNAYSGGNLLPANTTYQYPVQLTSNATDYVSFSTATNGAQSPTLLVPNGSTSVYVNYKVCVTQTNANCPPLPGTIVITATAAGVSAANVGTVNF